MTILHTAEVKSLSKQIIALGLLTLEDVERLGPHFRRAYPIDETPCFGELLRAIDEADRDIWRERDAANSANVATALVARKSR